MPSLPPCRRYDYALHFLWLKDDALQDAATRSKETILTKSALTLSSVLKTIGRIALGGALAFAGTGHLTTQRQEFQAQVPTWLPLDPDFVVLASGVVEISLGAALIVLPKYRVPVGWIATAFFVAIFPGNISQYVNQTDGFGLDTDRSRLIRLFFQPVLVAWALWSTGAWAAWRAKSR
jgi:uncharacterized membrane protein